MRSIRSSVNVRRVGQIGVDVGLLALAYYLSYVLRFDEGIPHRYEDLLAAHDRVRRRDEARGVRRVRPLLEALALRRPEGRGGDRQGGGGGHRGPDRRAVPALARAHRPAAWRDRARLPAHAGVRHRLALPVARAGGAPATRPAARARRARGADRRRGQRRPAGGLRAAPQPRAALGAGGVPGRRPAQAGHARGRPQGAGHHRRAAARARRRQAGRGDHRDPLRLRHAAPEESSRPAASAASLCARCPPPSSCSRAA